jgi:hypothetical protein
VLEVLNLKPFKGPTCIGVPFKEAPFITNDLGDVSVLTQTESKEGNAVTIKPASNCCFLESSTVLKITFCVPAFLI